MQLRGKTRAATGQNDAIMVKRQSKGLSLIGRLPQSGITVYEKQGKTIVRTAHNSSRPRRCTLKQFVQRQRMRHSVALWHGLSLVDTMFTEHQSAYSGFVALANRLPAVFVDKNDAQAYASFLMPDIPVSEGKLLSVRQHLNTVEGLPALVADLQKKDLSRGMKLRLYTAEQRIEYGTPKVYFHVREVKNDELVETAGGLALVGEEFADDNRGWALVLTDDKRCSSQGIVTRCTLYKQYATQEALLAAAKSHSNRKMRIELDGRP